VRRAVEVQVGPRALLALAAEGEVELRVGVLGALQVLVGAGALGALAVQGLVELGVDLLDAPAREHLAPRHGRGRPDDEQDGKEERRAGGRTALHEAPAAQPDPRRPRVRGPCASRFSRSSASSQAVA
jgi:hypothetical protein